MLKPYIMKKIAKTSRKSSGNLTSLLLSRKSSYKYFLMILFATLLSSLRTSAQQCSFKLSTTDNIESVNDEGRTYFIQLQNNSNEQIGINISVSNNNTGNNPDQTISNNNVTLNAQILNENGQEIIGSVQLNPNEILKIQVKVTVPVGTPFKHWNSILLNASSAICTDYSSSLILYTFIPDPSEN
jgi:hypothetical protein